MTRASLGQTRLIQQSRESEFRSGPDVLTSNPKITRNLILLSVAAIVWLSNARGSYAGCGDYVIIKGGATHPSARMVANHDLSSIDARLNPTWLLRLTVNPIGPIQHGRPCEGPGCQSGDAPEMLPATGLSTSRRSDQAHRSRVRDISSRTESNWPVPRNHGAAVRFSLLIERPPKSV